MKILGILLVIAGLVGLVTGSISFTTKEKVVDLGPIDVSRDKTTTQYIPTLAAVGAIVAGGALLAVGARQHS